MIATEHAVEHPAVPEGHIPHGTRRSYMVGFVLSVILTAIPFTLVMSGGLESRALTAVIVLLFAAVQIVVHMVLFLHMNFRVEGGWSLISLTFTSIVLIIAIAGTVWVMHNMDSNMMPGMEEMMEGASDVPAGESLSPEGDAPDGESSVPGQDMSPVE